MKRNNVLQIGALTLSLLTISVQVSAQSNPQPEPDASCIIVTASGASLSEAKTQFAKSCPREAREDCDPVNGDQWMCSTNNIDGSTPVPTVTNPEPDSTPTPDPKEPTPDQPPSGTCEAAGANLNAAILAYANSCPNIPRKDCDPTGSDGEWTCSSGVIGDSAPGLVVVNPTPVSPTPLSPTPVNPTPTDRIGRVDSNDLVALHYDNCPDPDDGHALVAGKAVIDRVGLSNVLVVNGTCSDRSRNAYQSESETVANAVWGTEWLDSNGDGDASEQTSAELWATTLANGGDVWVAEGGPSDFTARVLRRIKNQFSSVDIKKVHVVQHSTGNNFNEAQTREENMDLIRNEAVYIPIANGNGGGNGTAGFRGRSSFFVDTARQSAYANAWNAAFNYLDPNDRIDFSDTVELLYIIDETDTQTIDDFARNYLQ
ncbi:MAG: hypothetical protein AB8B64_26850 [Granulosicoccus sp.]